MRTWPPKSRTGSRAGVGLRRSYWLPHVRRAKTTLLAKLRRRPYLQLNTIQDIAGVRIDADLLLGEQTRLAREIADHFGADQPAIHDLRDHPHAGYRAVHVWLRLPAGRVEIQIRTILQSLWANFYELLADAYGRGIRYDERPEQLAAGVVPAQLQELVGVMQDASADLAMHEAEWQHCAEIEYPGQRAMALGEASKNKATVPRPCTGSTNKTGCGTT